MSIHKIDAWKEWINGFFSELETYEGQSNTNNTDKETFLSSILFFLDNNTEEAAEKVYNSFFRTYWIGSDKDNPFLNLIIKVNDFEKTAGSLIEKQRDHYLHAVYVFIIGVIIYHKSEKFRNIFYKDYLIKTGYQDYYTTQHEEFLYRWGLASLFHDVAYPLEITIRQLNAYYAYTASCDSRLAVTKKHLNIRGFDEYKTCQELIIKDEYKEEFHGKYGGLDFPKESCLLLAYDISKSLSIEPDQIYQCITEYDDKICEGIIDHAYFGALICLKWHSYLMHASQWNPAYFYFPVLDAASSIFLHNAYQHCFQKEFCLSPLTPQQKPIAFLLMLTDALQTWGRVAYGSVSRQEKPFGKVEFDFQDDGKKLRIVYTTSNTSEVNNIRQTINEILAIGELFDEFVITNSEEAQLDG